MCGSAVIPDLANAPVPTPRCPNCRYSLTDIPLDVAGRITCPECGSVNHASATYPRNVRRDIYRRYRRQLLFPILAIFIASMLVSFFPPFGTLVLGCSSMILFPISTVVLVVVALVKEVQREDGPGQCTTGAAIAVIVSCAVLAIVLIALQLWWFTKTMPHV